MTLYSLVIECEGSTYSTQLEADSARGAIDAYFDRVYAGSAPLIFRDAPKLSAEDIVHVRAMEGFVNMWLARAERDGRCFTVTCMRTDPVQEPETD